MTTHATCMVHTHRLLSISDGADALPCSIVLTKPEGEGREREEEVIGHARLMPVAGKHRAALIETGKVQNNPLLPSSFDSQIIVNSGHCS